ncbi:ATP-binding cassette domain-containing protein [Kitasatospora sp. RB6PN24]|uniref:FHA domain-containing protein n=1 Tax=Kitasatospora humi TaxID=2893891 RepID=UPI001E4FBC9B|nr:FHA domain-containing protein [Kitasatospora humi]MCC9312415.1 ATP-binding cassette domain-containing protein [Kitasatospora humi]
MGERQVAPIAPDLVLTSDGDSRVLTPSRSYHVGRDPGSEIPLSDPRVSWHHAVLHLGDGHWMLDDLDSANGTWSEGRRISRLDLGADSVIRFGNPGDGPEVELTVAPQQPAVPRPSALTPITGSYRPPTSIHPLVAHTLRIGRAPDNDLVLTDLEVSRHHAELHTTADGRCAITDLHSHNGTYLNGQPVTQAVIAPGDLLGIGHSEFCLVDGELQEFVDTGDITLDVADLVVTVDDDRRLLDGISFPVGQDCLLAVTGPSGSGKSTLLNALTGLRPADGGTVRYDGRDLYRDYAELRHRIGLVPQDDILHTQLTVRRALGYAAELRFPGDTGAAERTARVEEVIAELGLDKRADLVVASLSGGQRKRVSVALELLTKPSLLFLDEPTSGLDPGMDRSVMQMLRGLADDGRTVVVVTHSVLSLDLCDRLLMLAPGGRTAYYGPPGDALEYFGCTQWPQAFENFETQEDRDWEGEYRASPAYRRYITPMQRREGPAAPPVPIELPPPEAAEEAGAPPPGPPEQRDVPSEPAEQRSRLSEPTEQRSRLSAPAGHRSPRTPLPVVRRRARPVPLPAKPPPQPQRWDRQLGTLVRRYTAALAADRTFVVIMIALPFVMGVLARALAGGKLTQSSAFSALLILCVGGVLTGAANAVRELVKERVIYRRERAVGLSRSAYLCSKVVVLGTVTVVQAVVLTMVALAGVRLRPQGGSGVFLPPLAEIIIIMALLSFAGMMLGLLVSALVGKEEATMPLLVLLAIVQVVFTGTQLRLYGVPGLEQLSWLVPSRWAMAAMAATVDLRTIAPGNSLAADPLFRHSAGVWLLSAGMLLVLSLAYGLLVYWLLRRIEPAVMRRRARRRSPAGPGKPEAGRATAR